MSQSDRPELSLDIECQIEEAQNQIHAHYWPRFEQMQELTSAARQDYRKLGKHLGPPMPKQPNALRLLLRQYAIALFDSEAEYYPEAPGLLHWLGCLAGRIHSMVLGKILEIEEVGQFRYSTLKYHLSSEQMIRAISDGLQEHTLQTHVKRGLAQQLNESQQRLKSSANLSSASAPSRPNKPLEEQKSKRMPSTITSLIAARKVEAYIQQKGMGLTEFATRAGTTDRTLRTFRKTGKIRRSLFDGIVKAMGTTRESLLSD